MFVTCCRQVTAVFNNFNGELEAAGASLHAQALQQPALEASEFFQTIELGQLARSTGSPKIAAVSPGPVRKRKAQSYGAQLQRSGVCGRLVGVVSSISDVKLVIDRSINKCALRSLGCIAVMDEDEDELPLVTEAKKRRRLSPWTPWTPWKRGAPAAAKVTKKHSVGDAKACFDECNSLLASGDKVLDRTEAYVKALMVRVKVQLVWALVCNRQSHHNLGMTQFVDVVMWCD